MNDQKQSNQVNDAAIPNSGRQANRSRRSQVTAKFVLHQEAKIKKQIAEKEQQLAVLREELHKLEQARKICEAS